MYKKGTVNFIDLPGYAEARRDGFRLLEDADNGMGNTVGMVEKYLEDEIHEKAGELGLDYRPEENYEVLVSSVEKVAVLYDEFYEESMLPVAGARLWLCNETNGSDHKGGTSGKREFRVPSSGGEIFIDERNLRALEDHPQNNL